MTSVERAGSNVGASRRNPRDCEAAEKERPAAAAAAAEIWTSRAGGGPFFSCRFAIPGELSTCADTAAVSVDRGHSSPGPSSSASILSTFESASLCSTSSVRLMVQASRVQTANP